jgi:N-acetylglucosamine-6-phosphate deacetylase
MKTGLIIHATLVSPGIEKKDAVIEIQDDTIIAIHDIAPVLPSADWVYDAKGAYVVPGFIDIHTHGALGYDVTDTEEPCAIEKIAQAKLAEGCTQFCPTTLTLPEDQLAASLRNVAKYDNRYCKVCGIHLEGPYLNCNCLGAQNPAYVRTPDIEEVKRLSAISRVTQVSYAVELDHGVVFGKQLSQQGIVASCGHSKATYAQFFQGYQQGLKHLTHFCNQMSPLHHRDIGMVGAGFLLPDVKIEVICDKVHICPEMIELVFEKKPIESILLITDSMRSSHLPDGPSSIGGLDVIVKNGEARLASNGALAGSMLRMNVALKNVYEVTERPLCEIIQTTSYNQAVELGIGDKYGRVEAGYKADLTVLDTKTFDVRTVFKDGVNALCRG